MRTLLFLLMIFPTISYGQISKPGVQAENGGSVLGRALTVNCDNVCIVCGLSGTTVTISFNPLCSSGPPPSTNLTFLGVNLQFNGTLLMFKGD